MFAPLTKTNFRKTRSTTAGPANRFATLREKAAGFSKETQELEAKLEKLQKRMKNRDADQRSRKSDGIFK